MVSKLRAHAVDGPYARRIRRRTRRFAYSRYYQKLTRLSSGFALLSDAAMFVLGGSLKRRERLSARLGDILSWLYLASAVLKRYEDSGRPADDLPLVHWAMQDALRRSSKRFMACSKICRTGSSPWFCGSSFSRLVASSSCRATPSGTQ